MEKTLFNIFKYTLFLPILLVITPVLILIIFFAMISAVVDNDYDVVDNFIDRLIDIWKPRV